MTTYGNTTVATDNGNDNILGQGEVADDLSNEGRGTDNIESGNTKKATGRCQFLSNTSVDVERTAWDQRHRAS